MAERASSSTPTKAAAALALPNAPPEGEKPKKPKGKGKRTPDDEAKELVEKKEAQLIKLKVAAQAGYALVQRKNIKAVLHKIVVFDEEDPTVCVPVAYMLTGNGCYECRTGMINIDKDNNGSYKSPTALWDSVHFVYIKKEIVPLDSFVIPFVKFGQAICMVQGDGDQDIDMQRFLNNLDEFKRVVKNADVHFFYSMHKVQVNKWAAWLERYKENLKTSDALIRSDSTAPSSSTAPACSQSERYS